VLFPATNGKRSSLATGKAVWVAAAAAADEALAAAIGTEKNWRQKYRAHVTGVAEASARRRAAHAPALVTPPPPTPAAPGS
jgi:hypothetical protein